MKTLLVAEYRDGKVLACSNELIAFAQTMDAESAMVLVGGDEVVAYDGKLYLADVKECGECNPDMHKKVILDVVEKEKPEMIVFCHSSYGWDLAPRIAFALEAAQVSEVVEVRDGQLVVPTCNAKLRRTIDCKSSVTVATIQAGAFNLKEESQGSPEVIQLTMEGEGRTVFRGYEEAAEGGVDLSKAEVIVSAGRGIGKKDNVEIIVNLAKALGGEYGASRPVVDSEWVQHDRQVGTTGQTVAPKVYMACGISGAVQHLAGMKKSDFVVAINTDKDAPIGDEADVLVVADLLEFVPVLTEKIESL